MELKQKEIVEAIKDVAAEISKNGGAYIKFGIVERLDGSIVGAIEIKPYKGE